MKPVPLPQPLSVGHYWVFMGTKRIFKNKKGKIPSFKFWPYISRFLGGDTVSGSLSRICESAPAFCSDVPGIIIASSPDGFPRWLSGKRIRLPMQKTQEMWVQSVPGLGRSPGEGNGSPLHYSCLENSMDRGAQRATVYGVSKSWT